jgi:hypothetical protein
MDWTEGFDQSLLDKEALQFLIDYHLDGPAAGITARVITHGIGDLTEAQRNVFKKCVVDEWLIVTCRRCQRQLEGDELIGAWENSRYCGSCASGMYNDALREGIKNPF